MIRTIPLVCVMSMALVVSSGLATPLDPADARDKVRERLAQLQNYQADFAQSVTDGNGELLEESTGQFWLARPNRFRWEYQLPWPRLILSNGERIWLYDEELEQVTVRNFDGVLEQTPAALLAGRLELLDAYRVTGDCSEGILTVRLVPEQARADFRSIEITFADDLLTEMRLQDSFGQLTRITFASIDSNASPEDGLFDFVVPEGADVIDESGGPG